jgi:hypothetical protein
MADDNDEGARFQRAKSLRRQIEARRRSTKRRPRSPRDFIEQKMRERARRRQESGDADEV